MEKQKVIMLVLCLCSMLSNYAQKEVTYFINEKDTLMYKDGEYVFNKLQYNNISIELSSLIRCLSLNKSAEMYVMKISNHNGKLSILIQNWEYRGIVSLRKRNVYGMYTPVRDKDLLRKVPIAYSFQCTLAVPRAYSRRNSMQPMPHKDS